jgi:hypothetical protein
MARVVRASSAVRAARGTRGWDLGFGVPYYGGRAARWRYLRGHADYCCFVL